MRLNTYLSRPWAIFLGVALVIIDSTLVNVALPVMARELHISDGAATWFVQAYQIVLLTLLFPAIALSPLVGCKRFFLCGIALFVAASLGCALSRTPGSLCLFRILQAVGGSAMLSVNIALVERVFKKGRLATGIGFNTATISISIIIGPALGGFMLTHVSWPWLFAINLPLGLLALLAAWKHVPGEQHTRLAREHLREFAVILGLSILLFAGFLASLGVFSWGLPWQILPGTLLLLLCGARLLVRQQRVGSLVLFPEHVLLNKPFLFSLLVTIVCFMAQSGTVLAMPFAFMEGLGFDIQDTSLLLVAWPALHSVTSLASGKLGKLVRRGNRAVLGIVFGACGIVLFAFAPTLPSGASRQLSPCVDWDTGFFGHKTRQPCSFLPLPACFFAQQGYCCLPMPQPLPSGAWPPLSPCAAGIRTISGAKRDSNAHVCRSLRQGKNKLACFLLQNAGPDPGHHGYGRLPAQGPLQPGNSPSCLLPWREVWASFSLLCAQ